MAVQKQDDQHDHNIQQLCEDTGCCPEDLPKAMNDREKWRERGQGYLCYQQNMMMMIWLLALDRNRWNHINVCKEIIIIR